MERSYLIQNMEINSTIWNVSESVNTYKIDYQLIRNIL
jgi:hypothetical protein